MELNAHMNRFRVASRELFNQYFRVDDPYHDEQAWDLRDRYNDVEALLFEKLVLEPAELAYVKYGTLHPNLEVRMRSGSGESMPIMLNREIHSGYWDYPVKTVSRDVRLGFIAYFDWDQLAYRDHRYVRVQVLDWSSAPEVVGKHGLVETQYVCFGKG